MSSTSGWIWAKATWPDQSDLLTEAQIAGLTLSEALLAIAVNRAEDAAVIAEATAKIVDEHLKGDRS